MKKFVLLHYGFEPPTQENMVTWNNWLTLFGEKMIDSGSLFGYGREITKTGSKELPLDLEAITGYTIISANYIKEAEIIANGCAFTTSIRAYKAISMVSQMNGQECPTLLIK